MFWKAMPDYDTKTTADEWSERSPCPYTTLHTQPSPGDVLGHESIESEAVEVRGRFYSCPVLTWAPVALASHRLGCSECS